MRQRSAAVGSGTTVMFSYCITQSGFIKLHSQKKSGCNILEIYDPWNYRMTFTQPFLRAMCAQNIKYIHKIHTIHTIHTIVKKKSRMLDTALNIADTTYMEMNQCESSREAVTIHTPPFVSFCHFWQLIISSVLRCWWSELKTIPVEKLFF